MFPLSIVHQGHAFALAAGGAFSRPRTHGFRDTGSADLQALIAEIDAGRPWREAVAARYETAKPWLHRIITDPARTAFFGDVLPLGCGPVLDIGSGWGQTARPLAQHGPVVALEPVAERLAFIQAAARQDGLSDRMAFVEADYFDVTFPTPLAAICAIGVFEWVGAFQEEMEPQECQRAFLRKAHAEIAPGGSLILGIENRLGLKYLLGCPDDHLGVPHIASLPAALARRRWQEKTGNRLLSYTYSLTELSGMLTQAGFAWLEFFGAFPDYKLPARIIPLGEDGRHLDEWLRREPLPPEHNGYDGSPLPPAWQQMLAEHYQGLARQGTAHHFVPSFFVRARRD